MPPTVIKIENLSKYYRLGLIGSGTLREDMGRWIARMRGLPDPLLKIGEKDHGNRKDGQIWALKGINLEIKQGEVLGVIGGNGAGKSTLLKILSKITAPTTGSIKIKGRIGSLLEVGTGFHPELTGRENIYLNGAILSMPRQEISAKLEEIIEFAEMSKFIDTPVKRYSSGMTVRLAFAVAAHLEPEILIIDEVLAVGDAVFQKKCLGKMGEVAQQGRTVLFVSHNMNSIKSLCTKAVLLESGILKNIGCTEGVVDSYLTKNIQEKNNTNSYPSGYIFHKDVEASNKDFDVIGLQLLDMKREPINNAVTWEPLIVRIHYAAKSEVKRGSITVLVKARDGTKLLLCSTQPDSGVPLHIYPGVNSIDCIFRKWPLTGGLFVLGIGIAVPMVEYLFLDESICIIHTEGRDIFNSGMVPVADRYLVATDHDWEL